MEKIVQIKRKDVEAGFYLELFCFCCGTEKTFGGSSVRDVLRQAKEDGWSQLNSDDMQTVGHWCGCSYK